MPKQAGLAEATKPGPSEQVVHVHDWRSITVDGLNARGINGLTSSGGEGRTFLWFVCHCGRYKSEVASKKPERSIGRWVRDSHEQAKSKGWHDGEKRDFGTLIALMHSELTEALEEARNGHALNEVYLGEKGKPEGVGIEFADVLIRIFDACGLHGIDLEAALEQKFAFNETRPHKHGGKKF